MTIHELAAGSVQVAPLGAVVSIGLLQVLGHLQRARECWASDRERRMARDRLRRSAAAWERFKQRERLGLEKASG